MHDFDILKHYGSTPQRIRDVFTSQDGENFEIRQKWEKRIQSRIHEGARHNLNHYSFFAASDLAWDSNVISKMLVPLQLYAQGRVQLEYVKNELKDVPQEVRDQIAKTDPKTNEITGLNIPEFFKVSFNLVRSLITRRCAAITSNYSGNYPFFKYDPRSTSQVAKLRADVLSQRVQMIVDQYGYQHDLVQTIREMLLYPFSVEFVSGGWDVELTIAKKELRAELQNEQNQLFESRVTREGILFNRPHPSRIFWDYTSSLNSLNFDTGVQYIGYWNVLPYRNLCDNTAFFNRDKIEYSYNVSTLLNGYNAYWELYFSSSPVNFPDGKATGILDLAGENDRNKVAGRYTSEMQDRSIFLTEYFERIIPKDHGLGDYPCPIWVRLVVAGGLTVIYGEFLPDTPGVVYQYNNHDGRVLNNAFATDIIPYQDQLSNMLTNLLHAQKAASIKVISADIDQINDPEQLKMVREQVQGDGVYTKPLWVEYKGAQYSEIGVRPREVITVSETSAINDVTMYLRSAAQVISMAERNLGASANEAAQSEPREVSATENANIATTVNTTINFMGLGVDEGLDAKKRIVYKGLMARGSTKIQVPVANRYLEATIKAAGFDFVPEENDQQVGTNLTDPKRFTILGTKQQLEYEYAFTSREGSERSSNAKAAEVLVNLLAQIASIPNVLQDLGKEQLYAFLNEVVRLSGASVDLRFGLKDGESEQVKTGDPTTDNFKSVEAAIQQITQAIQADRGMIQQIAQTLAQLTGAPAAATPAAAPAPGAAAPTPPI